RGARGLAGAVATGSKAEQVSGNTGGSACQQQGLSVDVSGSLPAIAGLDWSSVTTGQAGCDFQRPEADSGATGLHGGILDGPRSQLSPAISHGSRKAGITCRCECSSEVVPCLRTFSLNGAPKCRMVIPDYSVRSAVYARRCVSDSSLCRFGVRDLVV
ncbi:MAG: hypothetical protein RLZZ232_2080, partial [Planctomycetota bacterium]